MNYVLKGAAVRRLKFDKIVVALYKSRTRFYNHFYENRIEISSVRDEIFTVALQKVLDYLWVPFFRELQSNLGLQSKSDHLRTFSLSFLKTFELQNVMTYKFLRRLRYLITKRGGKQRAFNSLLLVQYSLKPKAKALFQSNRFANNRLRDPFFRVLKKLRVYFFIRKFTKNRKTLLLPGILRKRKRIRVIAR